MTRLRRRKANSFRGAHPVRDRARRPSTEETILFVLDSFNKGDVETWRAAASKGSKFEYALYYCLESQRAGIYESLLEATREACLPVFAFENWTRLNALKHHPLSSEGSLLQVGGRFNYGRRIDESRFTPFPALYLAQDFGTAFLEKFAVSQEEHRSGLTAFDLAQMSQSSLIVAKLRGSVHLAFDLRTPSSLRRHARLMRDFTIPKEVLELADDLKISPPKVLTTAEELQASFLDPNWRARPMQMDVPSNSQIFGKLLLDAGCEAVIYPSSKDKKDCLAIFPRLFEKSDSYVEILEPSENMTARMDRHNFKEFSRGA